MAEFLESLQQCNHWTFRSPWSHSWHVLKEGSSKMPLTCFIKQHTKLLHMQNLWHESKPWRLHSADEKLFEVEHFALSPLMSDIIIVISVWCRPAMCCCMSVRASREHASNSVTEVILMAPFIEQCWVTVWSHVVAGHGRLAERQVSTLRPYTCYGTVSPITIASSSPSSSTSEADSSCHLAALWSLP